MDYLFSIQIDNEIMLYIKKFDDQNSEHQSYNSLDLSKYLGNFGAYDSDDSRIFDFSITLEDSLTNESISYKEIDQNDIRIIITEVFSNTILFQDYVVKDQIKYWIFENVKERIEQNFDGVEADETHNDDMELNPYDPDLIRVDPKQMSVSYIHDLINIYSSLELSADFQRNFIWTDAKRKSRLIESILLRIPLPAFYFSTDEFGNYEIVDGLQRINVINMFINGEFKLTDLEYLEECEQCFFSERHDRKKGKSKRRYLDPRYVRRILETQLSINVIDPQTPSKVKYDIFKRLNTGGKPLNNMEIRNSFASQRIRLFLRSFTEMKEYEESSLSSVNSTRFADLELILRFIGFYLGEIDSNIDFEYKGKMEHYLDNVVEYLKTLSQNELNYIKSEYKKMLVICNRLFGKYAFRKVFEHVTTGHYKMPFVNKSLFTAVSIMSLNYYSELIEVDSYSIKKNVEKLGIAIEKNHKFFESLSYGTNDRERIAKVFNYTDLYFIDILEEYSDKKNND